MIFRPVTGQDLGRLMPLLAPDPASVLTAGTYQTRCGNREYRPEWTWIAEEHAGEPPAAAAVWWGDPRGSRPSALDGLFVRASVAADDRVALAAGLLTAAHREFAAAGTLRLPAFHVFLPGDWQHRPDVVAALA